MIARQYSRKIILKEATSVADGFGGFVTTDVVLANVWAEVKQNSAFKDGNQGTNDLKNSYTLKIRNNSAFDGKLDNISIEYKGQQFGVSSWEYDDELFRFVTILATGKR